MSQSYAICDPKKKDLCPFFPGIAEEKIANCKDRKLIVKIRNF